MKHVLLVLLLLFPVIAATQSDSLTDLSNSGSDYLRVCEAPTVGATSAHGLECVAWMAGVFDGFNAYNAVTHTELYRLPADATLDKATKIAVKYMNDHPKSLNRATSLLVLRALMDAYPVPK